MQDGVQEFRITRYAFPRDRVIGDSHVTYDMNYVGALELTDNQGLVGLGFFFSLMEPLPSESELTKLFRGEYMPGIVGRMAESLIHRVAHPSGGNVTPSTYSLHQAIDQALWDLAAQKAGVPLYRYLGGEDRMVQVYASGCCFPLSEDDMYAFYDSVRAYGCKAYKVKVGHPDMEWDLRRLAIVREVVGPEPLMMVDANEAWSPSEAIRRVKTYADKGFPIYWVEDPIQRYDIAGLKEFKQACPETLTNSGEYLDISGKRNLVEQRAADVINIHGDISGALRMGWVCAEYDTPISLGNTPMELGAHIAAALPDVLTTEVSFQNQHEMLSEKLIVEDGFIALPEVPGHGLKLSVDAQSELRQPEAL